MFTYQDIILNLAPARRGPAPVCVCQTGSDVSAGRDKDERPPARGEGAPRPCLLDLNNPLIYKPSQAAAPEWRPPAPDAGPGGERRRQLRRNARIGERGSPGPAHLLTFWEPSW